MGNYKNALSEVTKIGNYAIPAFSAFLTASFAVGSFPKSAEWQAIIVNFGLFTVAAAYVSYLHRLSYLRWQNAQRERGERPTDLPTCAVILFLGLHLALVSWLFIRLWPLGSLDRYSYSALQKEGNLVWIETILTSAVIAAGVSGFISVLMSERRIEIENITQERTKWRSEVRKVSKSIHDAIISQNATPLKGLISEFRLLVDPTDPDDRAILEFLADEGQENEEQRATEFAKRVSLMLKYDWERTKFEAQPFWRKWCKNHPRRITFQEYRRDFPHR